MAIKIVRLPGKTTTVNGTGTVSQLLAQAGWALEAGETITVGGAPASLDTQVSDGSSILLSKSAKGNARVATVTQVDGVNENKLSDDDLFSKARSIRNEIQELTKANEGVGSAKIEAKIKSLNEDLAAVVKLLDGRPENK